MDIPFTGGCACRALRYKCTGAPRYMGNCHCRDCQRATGSAYFAAVLIRAEEFFLIKTINVKYNATAVHHYEVVIVPSTLFSTTDILA